jgi:hypothetical protein
MTICVTEIYAAQVETIAVVAGTTIEIKATETSGDKLVTKGDISNVKKTTIAIIRSLRIL